jgi:hypothetical protein
MLTVMACASEPVRIELPLTHPANPRAPEGGFTPPPNPFMNKVYSAKPAAPVEPSMVHKMHEGAGNDNSQYVDDQYQKAQVRTPEVHTPYKLKTASRTDIFAIRRQNSVSPPNEYQIVLACCGTW